MPHPLALISAALPLSPSGLGGDALDDVSDSEDLEMAQEVDWSVRIQDDDTHVRCSALQALQNQGPEAVGLHMSALITCVQDANDEVKQIALQLLASVDIVYLLGYVQQLVMLIAHEDVFVKHTVAEVLCGVPGYALSSHTDSIMQCLLNEDIFAQHIAKKLLRRMQGNTLVDQVPFLIQQGLKHKCSSVRRSCLEVMTLLPDDTFNSLAPPFLACLQDADIQVRWNAQDCLCRLDANTLDKYLHVKVGEDRRSTLLHVAAAHGHLPLCKRLVSHGAMLLVQDGSGLTPEELAFRCCQSETFNFLSERSSAASLHLKIKLGFVAAVNDRRPIVKAEWFTTSLPGWVGQAGALHSVVALTVADNSGQPPATYTVEKAASVAVNSSGLSPDTDHCKNGVVISRWEDVAHCLEEAATRIHCVEGLDIANNTGEPALCLASIRNVAVALGPYNVATCNCHHAALAVFNACASQRKQVQGIPNELLTFMAGLLGMMGMNLGTYDLGDAQHITFPSEEQFDADCDINQKLIRVRSTKALPAPHGDNIEVAAVEEPLPEPQEGLQNEVDELASPSASLQNEPLPEPMPESDADNHSQKSLSTEESSPLQTDDGALVVFDI
mmetsp:Transcript_42253/g.99218  ORF Transcript_42253/g.99218 Transcript_42253/m.99218 type:complete len:613 (-) Transcript_42253:108-1946(-)